MRGYILLCFFILAYGRPQDDFQTAMISKHECKVIEKKSGVSKLCAGAFIFENQTHYGSMVLLIKDVECNHTVVSNSLAQ